MPELPALWLLMVLAVGATTLQLAWTELPLWRKAVGVISSVLMLAFLLQALIDLAGTPRDASLEWWARNADEAVVLGAEIAEDQGRIYLWLKLREYDTPMAYVMAYEQKLAEQLQDAMAQAKRNGGTGVIVKLPFEGSLETQRRFYPIPQIKMPDKPIVEAPPAQRYGPNG